jgi:hypothetical protein
MLMSKAEALFYIFGIIEERYFLTKDDQVGQLCTDLNPGGREGNILYTGDPAAWSDWEESVNKITTDEQISEIQALKAMIELMKTYNKQGFHLDETINHFKYVLIPPNSR